MTRIYTDYIKDIIEAMDNALLFIENMTYRDFSQDSKTIYAVIRAIEIIGEAVKNIPSEIKEKYPQIPWKGMAGMRDITIHRYFGVDTKVIWKTVTLTIPKLRPFFERILNDYNG